MKKRSCLGWLAVVVALLAPAASAAASRIVKAGENLPVSEDYVLTGEDVLEIQGTAEKPCRIDANGHTIKTNGKWTGQIKIRYCEFRGLGSATRAALELIAGGDGDRIVIENSDFLACGAIHITNNDNSRTVFRGNTVHANSMVPVTNLPSDSPPGFRANGSSPAPKRFQGNRISRSIVQFENTRNWLIGGDEPADSNILIGMRASLSILTSSDMTVRGNYLHTEIPSFRWSQVHTLLVGSPCPGLVIEHNIFRHGQWVVRGLQGEFRYNLVLDADGHNFIIGPREHTHIHHNIFARYCTIDPNLNATIGVIYKGADIEIYNNTFDGGGKDLARPWHVPAVEVGGEAFLQSLRSNVFFNHPTRFGAGTAIIRPGFGEKKSDPAPERLGYADYNLFHNPDAAERQNYAVRVRGKTERVDPGFAKNDVPAGGSKDAQVDPKFKGPIPKQFPFADADIWARKVTVWQVLAAYADAYAPGEGSPLIGAGDPADGKGNYIGAIGPSKDSPNNSFGRPAAPREGKKLEEKKP